MCRKGRRSSLTHCRTAVSINYPMKMETATHKYISAPKNPPSLTGIDVLLGRGNLQQNKAEKTLIR